MKKITKRQIEKMDRLAFALEALQREVGERNIRTAEQIGRAKSELIRAIGYAAQAER